MVVGTSLGGAIAVDFALEYPDAVEKLVLVDAQGFIDGLGPWRVAPKFLINLLVQVSPSCSLPYMYCHMFACTETQLSSHDVQYNCGAFVDRVLCTAIVQRCWQRCVLSSVAIAKVLQGIVTGSCRGCGHQCI